jgi:hypothetical protein
LVGGPGSAAAFFGQRNPLLVHVFSMSSAAAPRTELGRKKCCLKKMLLESQTCPKNVA